MHPIFLSYTIVTISDSNHL